MSMANKLFGIFLFLILSACTAPPKGPLTDEQTVRQDNGEVEKKAQGITPFLPLNHKFTTSLYYRDPDGNEVELSVDNFPSKAECDEFIRSERMNEIGYPPFGCEFDAEELARLYHQGVPDVELAKIGIPDQTSS